MLRASLFSQSEKNIILKANIAVPKYRIVSGMATCFQYSIEYNNGPIHPKTRQQNPQPKLLLKASTTIQICPEKIIIIDIVFVHSK
jgi:hypothetical protein